VTRLLLLRHAESEWNAQGRWQGVADPPLSAKGEAQADQAGLLLRPSGMSAMVSSDLRRARDTAARIAAALPLPGSIGVDPGLREYDLGAWSGLTRAEIEAGWPGEIEDWRHGRLFATPGGEKRSEFVARIGAAIARVAAEHGGETVLVISHGGVISALARMLGGAPLRFTHLAGFWIESEGDGLRIGSEVSLLGPARPPSRQGEGSDPGDGTDSVVGTVGKGTELTTSSVIDTPAR